MTKTKTTLKCRIIEYDVFEKSETSIGLVWPAGQARPGQARLQDRSLIFSLACRRFGSDQARRQARPGWKKMACWQLWLEYHHLMKMNDYYWMLVVAE
jgi:hypothetical protein